MKLVWTRIPSTTTDPDDPEGYCNSGSDVQTEIAPGLVASIFRYGPKDWGIEIMDGEVSIYLGESKTRKDCVKFATDYAAEACNLDPVRRWNIKHQANLAHVAAFRRIASDKVWAEYVAEHPEWA